MIVAMSGFEVQRRRSYRKRQISQDSWAQPHSPSPRCSALALPKLGEAVFEVDGGVYRFSSTKRSGIKAESSGTSLQRADWSLPPSLAALADSAQSALAHSELKASAFSLAKV